MEKLLKIEDFYIDKSLPVPDNINAEIGHFNVFSFEPFLGFDPQPVPYTRRDYFKISLMIGDPVISYADKVVKIQKHALVFNNPFIPYSCERLKVTGGAFCIFDQVFFHQYGNLNQYPMFQPGGEKVFELQEDQIEKVKGIYERMFEEIKSDYIYKYDLIRTLVYELIHFALKIQPAARIEKPEINASKRISVLFHELLERQFPINDKHPQVALRSASDYANQLAVHVNHLNRAIKETTQKTTSAIIAERIVQEAKVMLKHTAFNVSEVAYALGFSEVTNFNSFFKKHVQLSPAKFRNV